MSDARHVLVNGWEPIEHAPEPALTDKDKQRVATIFTEQSWDHVMWTPEWLLEDEDKDIETVESSEHLAVGDVVDYSEKAWQFTQPHREHSPGGYLPKASVVVFERATGVETIETPQTGLAAFAGGGDGVE